MNLRVEIGLFVVEGVETVKADSDAGKVTVTGKVDPTKVRDNLAEKIRKKGRRRRQLKVKSLSSLN